jgi:osmotically-inducible protein OsmY
MHRTALTAALVAALVPVAACNRAYSDRDAAESSLPAESTEAPVATSGTLPAAAGSDDAAVTTRIQAKYFLDPAIKVRRIDVDTQDGVVTLRGDVASHNERAQALLLARTTHGVERVEDALTVNAAMDVSQPVPSSTIPNAASSAAATEPAPSVGQPSAPSAPAQGNTVPDPAAEDESLAALVQSRFAEDTSLKNVTITVTAKDGVLLLDGTAPNAALKHRAITVARDTQGVVQVVDRIRVAR